MIEALKKLIVCILAVTGAATTANFPNRIEIVQQAAFPLCSGNLKYDPVCYESIEGGISALAKIKNNCGFAYKNFKMKPEEFNRCVDIAVLQLQDERFLHRTLRFFDSFVMGEVSKAVKSDYAEVYAFNHEEEEL